MTSCLLRLFVAALLSSLVTPVSGSSTPAPLRRAEVELTIDRPAAWVVSIENDKFFAGTDHHYTQGAKVTRLYNRASAGIVENALRVPLDLSPLSLSSAKIARSFGQDMFTPTDTEATGLLANDRPYAGWLYYSVGYHAIVTPVRCWIAEVTAGVVGPSSLGGTIQNRWHDLLRIERSKGWANQLEDEPGVNLALEHRWRWFEKSHWGDVLPRVGLVAGNVNTHLSAGGALRIGWDLPKDFGHDLIRAGSGNVEKPSGPFSVYAFASGDARLVGRNIFLDGNTWRESHSVRKRPLTWDLSYGVALNARRFRLIYAQNYRAKEFYGQLRRDVFGSISVAFLQ